MKFQDLIHYGANLILQLKISYKNHDDTIRDRDIKICWLVGNNENPLRN
jgi:hypothetical protein